VGVSVLATSSECICGWGCVGDLLRGCGCVEGSSECIRKCGCVCDLLRVYMCMCTGDLQSVYVGVGVLATF